MKKLIMSAAAAFAALMLIAAPAQAQPKVKEKVSVAPAGRHPPRRGPRHPVSHHQGIRRQGAGPEDP